MRTTERKSSDQYLDLHPRERLKTGEISLVSEWIFVIKSDENSAWNTIKKIDHFVCKITYYINSSNFASKSNTYEMIFVLNILDYYCILKILLRNKSSFHTRRIYVELNLRMQSLYDKLHWCSKLGEFAYFIKFHQEN